MKIRQKLTLMMVLIAVGASIALLSFSFYHFDSYIITHSKDELNAIANIQKSRIEELIEKDFDQLNQISNRTGIISALANYNQNRDQADLEALTTRLIDAQKSLPNYEAVAIFNLENDLIATSNQNFDIKNYYNINDLSKDYTENKIKISAQKEIKIVLHGPIKQDSQTLGVLVIISKVDDYAKIGENYTGLGETGETAIAGRDANGDAVYLRSPRFSKNKDEITRVTKDRTDIAITQALLKNEKMLTETKDYRDHAVYAVTKYIASTDWGLVVKIDRAEINQVIYVDAAWLISITLLIILIVIMVSRNLAKKISQPIQELSDFSVQVTKNNDLSQKIEIKSKDEIGLLANNFNEMIAAIKASRAEIDQKVEAQTGEIKQKQEDLANQQKAILNILEDVEDEKNLTAREKEKIETILQSIGDAVFVVDADLKIILINPVTIDVSGFAAAELIGKKYSDVLKFIYESDNKKEFKVNDKFIKDAISTGEVQEMSNHTVLITKDGKHIPVSDSAAPLKDKNGKITGCVVVFRDVTREYEIDKAKTEFVSLASHQLRTPLSAVNWYAEMLINGDAGKLSENQMKYLQEIYKGNQRMVNLVNALLDVSRIELGTFAITPTKTDIVDLAKSMVKENKLLADKKKIVLTEKYDQIPELLVDPKLVQIIFQNLLSNAVKYTPDGGKVALTITKKEPNILIEVKDTGIGIPKAQQSHMYEKLFRADNVRAKDTEGTGLGLYIVKAIVDQSDGKIWFESIENKGTSFFVEIPIKGMPKKEGTKALEDIK